MSTTTQIRTKPNTKLSAANASIAGSSAFLIILIALHFIKTEMDPSWRMISEYEIGDYGWIMQSAFIFLAFSCVALVASIRPSITSKVGKTGLIALCLTACGMTLAALGTADPITLPADEATTHGFVHGIGSLGIPLFPIAATLITVGIMRNNVWRESLSSIKIAVGFVWLGLISQIASVALMLPGNDGKFGPDVLIGWPNRFLIVTYAAWIIVVAFQARRRR